MQTNNLALVKEYAIDFINYYIKQAGEGWVFEEKDDMSFFKMTPKPFELVADIDFCLNSTDSFEVELYGKVGDEIIPFDEVVGAMRSACRRMNVDLRETARGGLAATATALEITKNISMENED